VGGRRRHLQMPSQLQWRSAGAERYL
jgi:hypothetical protein